VKDEPGYDLLSFVPQLKLVGDSLCTDGLPEAQFPYTKKPSNVKEKAGAGVGKKTKAFQKKDNKKWWDKKTTAKPEEALSSGPPLIIFVAGGMTHSEMRTAYVSCFSVRSLSSRTLIP
jgi:syntaxin-binding protein 1